MKKQTIQRALIAIVFFAGLHANAANKLLCADNIAQLSSIAKQSRQLPDGFERQIFGNWKINRKISGHDVLVGIRQISSKGGALQVRVRVSGWFKNFDETQALRICAIEGRSTFQIRTRINGSHQQLEVQVLDLNTIRLLDGQIAGVYVKQ